MKWLVLLAVVTVLIALYVVWLRPMMRKTSWGASFLDWIEPVERKLWWKSETIFFARAKMFIGLLLTALTQLGTIDITPLMPFVPDQYEGVVKVAWNALPLIITVMGWVDEQLRKDTTKPLEIVAMRTDAPIEVKVAAAEADALNKQAAAVVAASDSAADTGVVS